MLCIVLDVLPRLRVAAVVAVMIPCWVIATSLLPRMLILQAPIQSFVSVSPRMRFSRSARVVAIAERQRRTTHVVIILRCRMLRGLVAVSTLEDERAYGVLIASFGHVERCLVER